ncbi:DUF3800 domain-containing protein [Patescibacteria group bacterium]
MVCFKDEIGNEHKPSNKTLIVFIDETGGECLSDPNYPIFGMGGCMIPASLYVTNIINPWLFLKNKEFEGSGKSLHATDLQKPSPSQIKILNKFFSSCTFGRFSVVVSDKTVLGAEVDLYNLIAASLFQRIEDIAKNTDFEDMIMIFEESERTRGINANFFNRYKFIKNEKDVPIKKFNMLKSEIEPGLEVADFIIHTAGTSVRDRLSGKRTREKERKDFEKVFKNVDNRLSSFLEITRVERA